MMCIALAKKDNITEDAGIALQKRGFDENHVMSNVGAVTEAEERDIIANLKYSPRKDVGPHHYEYNKHRIEIEGRPVTQYHENDGARESEDESGARAIHRVAANRIRTLMTRTASNLTGYDWLAGETRDVYTQALQRERAKHDPSGGKDVFMSGVASTLDGNQDLPCEIPRSRTFVDRSRDPRLQKSINEVQDFAFDHIQ